MNYNKELKKPHQLIIEYENKDNRIYEPIYHYTSANGFQGIVKNGSKLTFWFTRSDCLNDISEGSYIEQIYKETILDMFNCKKIDNTFYELIKDIKPSAKMMFDYPIPATQEEGAIVYNSVIDYAENEAFVCCFSLANDSLDMWRYYSKKDGGYALCLSPFLFNKQKRYKQEEYNSDSYYSNVKGFYVIYDEKHQKTLIEEYVLSCFSLYSSDYYPADIDKNMNTVYNIKKFFEHFQFVFKHPCFASEKEYRFVFYQPVEKPKDLKNKMYEIKYRTQDGMLTPYIEITVDKADCLLDRIVISPLLNDDSVISRTEHFLKQCGFDKCIVEKSKLPVR